MDNIQSVSDVLKDPCASTWIKNAIRTALDRDPVDAANDAEWLAAILKARGACEPDTFTGCLFCGCQDHDVPQCPVAQLRCGRCGEPGACGAAGLCYACNELADEQERDEHRKETTMLEITAYELYCGCLDRREAKAGGTVTLWREHGVYHVREWDRETGRREWNSFRTLAPARRAFRKVRS